MVNKTGSNIHHEATDRANAVQWRITELYNDIEILSLRELKAKKQHRSGFKLAINLCYEAIDVLVGQVKG